MTTSRNQRDLAPRIRQVVDLLPKHGWQVKPAAIEAGYSPSYAERLATLLKKDIRFCQAVEAKRREFMAATGWDCQKWQQECVSRFEHCVQPRSEDGAIAIDETNAKAYLDMLGRHTGAYAEDNSQRAERIAIILR
jgi:hypothetical protein